MSNKSLTALIVGVVLGIPPALKTKMTAMPQLVALSATFFVIEVSWQLVYAFGGARLKHWLTSPRRLRLMNRFAGGSFMAAGVALSTVSRA